LTFTSRAAEGGFEKSRLTRPRVIEILLVALSPLGDSSQAPNALPAGKPRTIGTVFTVINNTSASPITGTFSNLADGSVFTSNGNNFQANYEGGDGKDLTLTVVP
jgi:hypothetical protein